MIFSDLQIGLHITFHQQPDDGMQELRATKGKKRAYPI